MKTFHLVFLFILIMTKAGVHAINISISSSHNLPVKLGDKLVITCKLSALVNGSNVPLIIFNKGDMISESCSVFNKELYQLNCKDGKEFKLEIKSVSWQDKGLWKCMYNEHTTSMNVNIYVHNNVSMTVNSIPVNILSPNLGPKAYPMKHESYTLLEGRGVDVNPYDLRQNQTVELICKSDCGYPTVYHTLNFRNSSNFTLELSQEDLKYYFVMCDEKKNLSSVTSVLKLNCWNYKLYGLFNLTCSTFYSYENYSLKISEDSVFILCPTDPIKWWKMTNGEMVNTGIGIMISFMLLMFLFLMLCRWKSYKHKGNYDSCHEGTRETEIGRGYKV